MKLKVDNIETLKLIIHLKLNICIEIAVQCLQQVERVSIQIFYIPL